MFKLFKNFRRSEVSIVLRGGSKLTLVASIELIDERRQFTVFAGYSSGTDEHYTGMFDKVTFESPTGMVPAQILEVHQDLASAAKELDWMSDKVHEMFIDGRSIDYIQEFVRDLFGSKRIVVASF